MSHVAVWAIGDLHLSFGVPNKKMDLFGPAWRDHAATLQKAWDRLVSPNDIILIPGDISWAMRLEQALPDLQWIDERPGTKVLIKGNHDYWWASVTQVRKALPPSLHVIQNDALSFGNIAIAGAKLWDTPEFSFDSLIDIQPTSFTSGPKDRTNDEDLFRRELGRLEASLQHLPKEASLKIAMTHYPPIGTDLMPSTVSALLEQYGVSLAVFGHLHSFKEGLPPLFGTARGVRYALCSCDYLHCSPLCVARDGKVV